jgi:DNA-binding protein H-NS
MSKTHLSKLTAQTLPEWRPEIDLEQMAKADRVWGRPKGIKKGGKLEPKYANPHDPNQTWSGRGEPAAMGFEPYGLEAARRKSTP